MVDTPNKPFRILSLDGGGVRGVFQAAFLVKLAEQLSERKLGTIAEHFNLIAGTSTGSIIAMGVALGIDPNRILDSYNSLAGKIFDKGRIRKFFSYITSGPRYDQAKLEKPLKDLFDNRQLGQAKTKVLITACSLDQFRYRTFTNMSELGSIDDNLSAVDVVLASAAAPTYFRAYRPQREKLSYVDGGLWANSPSLIAVLAANRRLGKHFDKIQLVSVATGDFPNGISPAIYNELLPISPRAIDTVLELMFSCQSKFADDYATRLLGKSNVIRISPQLQKLMRLDDAKGAISELPPLADIEAEKHMGEILAMLTKAPLPEVKGEIDIMETKWSADWFYEDGTLYVSDEVAFSRWITNTQFEGYGVVTYPDHDKQYTYSITGEVSRTGVVVLVFKAERFPTEANIGTACLQLSINAQTLTGSWTGFATMKLRDGNEVAKLRGGAVTMKRK